LIHQADWRRRRIESLWFVETRMCDSYGKDLISSFTNDITTEGSRNEFITVEGVTCTWCRAPLAVAVDGRYSPSPSQGEFAVDIRGETVQRDIGSLTKLFP
jgi:hypothetical protein